MLYDNALLLSNYADAYKIWSTPLFKTTIEDTIACIQAEMSAPQGGFYSALDADSEGVEGKFYVWSLEEIQHILPQSDFELFATAYDVTASGNWEEHTILWQKVTTDELAPRFHISVQEVQQRLAKARQLLLEARASRIRPITDDKQILAWNALMVKALLQCGQAIGNQNYVDLATTQADYLLSAFKHGQNPHTYYHTVKDGRGKHTAFLDDLVFLADALTALYQQTCHMPYLVEATRIVEYLFDYFYDSESGFCYYAAADASDLIVRQVDVYDNATPSGNSTLAHLLLDLSILANKPDWAARAEKMLLRLKSRIINQPYALGRWATALMRIPYPTVELAIIGADHQALTDDFYRQAMPHVLLVHSAAAQDNQLLLAGRGVAGQNRIYVCRNLSCQQPVATLSEALELIKTTSV